MGAAVTLKAETGRELKALGEEPVPASLPKYIGRVSSHTSIDCITKSNVRQLIWEHGKLLTDVPEPIFYDQPAENIYASGHGFSSGGHILHQLLRIC